MARVLSRRGSRHRLCERSTIQRNRRPAYAYVDPVHLRSLDELERPHRFTNGNERPAGECCAPGSARAHGSSNARSQFHTADMVKEDTTPHNVRNATTITSLRMRAHTLRAQYKRSWEVLCGVKPLSFESHSPEVGDDFAADEERLRKYIADHVARL